MSDRETPLTDANVASLTKTPDCFCEADFARDLERKLAEAKDEIWCLTDERDGNKALADGFRAKLAEAREVMHAAIVLIAAKGRHNTKLAYDGLREALARINGNDGSDAPGEKGKANEN